MLGLSTPPSFSFAKSSTTRPVIRGLICYVTTPLTTFTSVLGVEPAFVGLLKKQSLAPRAEMARVAKSVSIIEISKYY